MGTDNEPTAQDRKRREAAEGVIATMVALGGDLVQIDVHDGPCEACLRVQGKVFSITGNTPAFPVLTWDVVPPLHRGCGHVLMGTDEDFLRDRGEFERLQEFSSSSLVVTDGFEYQAMQAGKSPGREFAEGTKVAEEFRSRLAAKKPRRRRRRKPTKPDKEDPPPTGCCSLALLALPLMTLRWLMGK